MHMNLVYSNGTKNRQKLAVPNRAIEVSNVIHFGRTKFGNNGDPALYESKRLRVLGLPLR